MYGFRCRGSVSVHVTILLPEKHFKDMNIFLMHTRFTTHYLLNQKIYRRMQSKRIEMHCENNL